MGGGKSLAGRCHLTTQHWLSWLHTLCPTLYLAVVYGGRLDAGEQVGHDVVEERQVDRCKLRHVHVLHREQQNLQHKTLTRSRKEKETARVCSAKHKTLTCQRQEKKTCTSSSCDCFALFLIFARVRFHLSREWSNAYLNPIMARLANGGSHRTAILYTSNRMRKQVCRLICKQRIPVVCLLQGVSHPA